MAYDFTTYHVDKLAFDVHIDGHTTRIDTTEDDGSLNSGPSPKKLLLGTLAACTGIDVVGMLRKMRVPFSDLSIQTTAELTEEHPKVFTEVQVIYRIKVEERHRKKVQRAVDLSKDKYCGVSAMLKENSPVYYRIEFL